jgi:hypothetical protein
VRRLPLMMSCALACHRPPVAEESGEGNTDVCEPIDVQTDTCADLEQQPGEFCLGPTQTIELENDSGTPQRLRPELVVADFDADGAMDLMTGHAVGLGDGQGGFEIIKISLGIVGPQPGDFDGQPGVDIAYFYNVDMDYGVVDIILGGPAHPGDVNPQGTRLGGPDEARPVTIESLAVGDFNADGRDDVAVAAISTDFDVADKQLWLLTHGDNFEFDAELLSSTIEDDFPTRVFAGRLAGDAIDDLLWGRGQLLLGSSAGPTTGGEIWTSFGFNVNGASLLGHRVDCDDLPDLVVPISNGIVVFPGISAAPHIGGDYQQLGPPTEGSSEPWDVADLNNDGVPDVVVIGPEGLAISFTTSSGQLGPLTPIATPHPWVAARVADIDMDGSPELIGLFADQDDTNGGFEVVATQP